jgi:phage-related protein (TIGR01555 family)
MSGQSPPSLEERNDGVLINALTRMGTSRDRSSYTAIAPVSLLQEEELDSLYVSSWLCRRVVDLVASEATRAGWGITVGGEVNEAQKKRLDKLVSAGEALGIRDHVREALRMARHHGGAVIVLLLNDGLPISEPVDPKRLRSIRGLYAMDRWRIWPAPGWSGVGAPDRYQFVVYQDDDLKRAGMDEKEIGVPIHSSRLLRFDGDPLPQRLKSQNNWWGVSVLQSLWEVFKRYETGQKSGSAILDDFSLFVQKIKGLGQMVANGKEAAIQARLELNGLCRSVLGGIAIDADGEDVAWITRSLGGIDTVIGKLETEVQGASRIPHTKLWGASPSGLGADGRSEDAAFAMETAQQQQDHLDRPLRQFYELLAACSRGPSPMKLPEDWKIDFHATFALSDSEEAELRSKQATTDTTYIREQVLTPTEVALARFSGAKFSMETTLLNREPDGSIPQPDEGTGPDFGGDLESADPAGGDPASGDTPAEPTTPTAPAAAGTAELTPEEQAAAARGDGLAGASDPREDGCCSACDEEVAQQQKDTSAPEEEPIPDDGQALAAAIAQRIAKPGSARRRGRRAGVRADGARITGRRVVAGVPLEVRADGSAALVGPYGQPIARLNAAVGFDSEGLWEVLGAGGQWCAVVGVNDAELVSTAAGASARVRRLDGLDLIAMGVRCDSYGN